MIPRRLVCGQLYQAHREIVPSVSWIASADSWNSVVWPACFSAGWLGWRDNLFDSINSSVITRNSLWNSYQRYLRSKSNLEWSKYLVAYFAKSSFYREICSLWGSYLRIHSLISWSDRLAWPFSGTFCIEFCWHFCSRIFFANTKTLSLLFDPLVARSVWIEETLLCMFSSPLHSVSQTLWNSW